VAGGDEGLRNRPPSYFAFLEGPCKFHPFFPLLLLSFSIRLLIHFFSFFRLFFRLLLYFLLCLLFPLFYLNLVPVFRRAGRGAAAESTQAA